MMHVPSTSLRITVGRRRHENATTSSQSSSTSKPNNKEKKEETLTLLGRSRAGDGTAFFIPELEWMLDCGALINGKGNGAKGKDPTTLFLTHTHCDHVQCLASVLYRLGWDHKTLDIYLPAPAVPLVQAHLNAFLEMIGGTNSSSEMMKKEQEEENAALPEHDDDTGQSSLSFRPRQQQHNYKLLPITTTTADNPEIHIRQKGNDYVIKTYDCDHRIVCLGYGFWKKQKHLKPEYRGLAGPALGKLRTDGVDITMSELEPLFLFLGDTTSAVFTRYPTLVSDYPIVIVECTYLDPNDRTKATAMTHMHWLDLQPHIQAHPLTLFVLIHFSLKHSSLSIRRFFLEQAFHNVHPMILQEDVAAEWNKAKAKGLLRDETETMAPTCRCFQCQPPIQESTIQQHESIHPPTVS